MILVIAEQKDGRLNRATWEAVAAAQQLAGEAAIKVAVLGDGHEQVAAELAKADVAEVLDVDGPAGAYTPGAHAQAVEQIVGQQSPAYVLSPASRARW